MANFYFILNLSSVPRSSRSNVPAASGNLSIICEVIVVVLMTRAQLGKISDETLLLKQTIWTSFNFCSIAARHTRGIAVIVYSRPFPAFVTTSIG